MTGTTAEPPARALLEATGIGVRLGRTQVLDDVDLSVPVGGWSVVVGPNGAGKSTLLRAITGLVRYAGTLRFRVPSGVAGPGSRPGSQAGSQLENPSAAGDPGSGAVTVDLRSMPSRQRARLIGYAPQRPILPDGMIVADYVMLGRTPHRGLLAAPGGDDREEVDRALQLLDLTALADRQLRTLSGGEAQRAVLARVLAQRPALVLLDEPTSALDLGHAQQLLELIDTLRRSEGLTVLATLHDLVLAGQYSEHLMLLDGGRIAAAGTPQQVLTEANLAEHYGASARVVSGPDGVQVHPVRPTP